jgi:hypothetical protein
MLTASMKRTPSKTPDYTAQNPSHIHTCHFQNLNSLVLKQIISSMRIKPLLQSYFQISTLENDVYFELTQISALISYIQLLIFVHSEILIT